MCSVYVVGAVKKPGVYELAVGSRVNDAVKEAGGMTKKADISAVNLARVVADGEQITIPEMGEAARCDEPADNAQTMSTRNTSSAITADGKVNINSASSEELQALPGIGEATASKIIASRETEGPFSSTEDLKRVSGIGEKKYAALADLITV
jgi:competence protein ComEA